MNGQIDLSHCNIDTKGILAIKGRWRPWW